MKLLRRDKFIAIIDRYASQLEEYYHEALGLMMRIVDPNDCVEDHHGNCQEHGFNTAPFLEGTPPSECPQKTIKRLLDREGIQWK